MTQVWPKEPRVSLFATLRNPVGQGGGPPQVKGPPAAAGVQEGRLSGDQRLSSQQLQRHSLK